MNKKQGNYYKNKQHETVFISAKIISLLRCSNGPSYFHPGPGSLDFPASSSMRIPKFPMVPWDLERPGSVSESSQQDILFKQST